MSAAFCTSDNPSPPAVHTLYTGHHAWLLGWLRYKLGNQHDAADLAQDVFVRVLALRDAGIIREPRAFLHTIAHGLMVNHLRRRDIERTCMEALAALPPAHAPSPETRALLMEALVAIDTMLDGLPTRVRRAFLMSQLEGLAYADIARRLGVSLSSVKQYMLKATLHCLALRESLE